MIPEPPPTPIPESWRLAVAPAEKANALLALVKHAGAQAEALFKTLPLEEQQAVVLSAPPDQRLDLLNLPEDATRLVQSLPEMELHRTVMCVGKWEAQEVVEVASQEQLNFMLDHDCWRGEALDGRKFADWLQLFLECDEAQIFRILTAINADLLALALKKHVKFEKDFMIEDQYYLDPDWVKGGNPVVQQFLERLYAFDPNLWIRLLAWVRTNSKGTIEADAIEGREARLKGKGFPAPSLAITVYYPVEFDIKGLLAGWRTAATATPATPPGTAPAVRAGGSQPADGLFLAKVTRLLADQAAAATTAESAGRWEAELVEVANKVMIADQVDLGDLRQQREAVDKVRRWISLGLEIAATGDPEHGGRLLQERQVEWFFRLAAMLFDALESAIVELTKIEQRGGGVVSGSNLGYAYLALSEPEPLLPQSPQGGTRHILNASDYRLAWTYVWQLEQAARATAG
ncbi:MAG: DUF6178 family protein [Lentisphaeria bacterium]|jgi:hypothetical protein